MKEFFLKKTIFSRKNIFFSLVLVNLFGCGGGGNNADTINGSSNIILTSTPNDFIFIDQMGVDPNTVITSNTITINGINKTASISIAGGEYSIDGSAFTSTNGTIQNMQNVVIRQTSSSETLSTNNSILTVGGVSDTFSVTTRDNAPPQAENENHDVLSGSYVLRQSVGNDQDNETLFFEKLSDPQNGVITFDSNGLFIFTPNENFIGSDQFDYQITDAFGSQDSATISFDIHQPSSGSILDLRADGLTLNSLAAIWTSTQLTSDYEIRFSGEVITEDNWLQADIFGNNIVSSAEGLVESFYADQLNNDTAYYFAIRQIDSQGSMGPISNVIYAKTTPTPLALVNSNDISENTIGPVIVEYNQGDQKTFSVGNDGLVDLQYNLEILNGNNQLPSWVVLNDYSGSITGNVGDTVTIPVQAIFFQDEGYCDGQEEECSAFLVNSLDPSIDIDYTIRELQNVEFNDFGGGNLNNDFLVLGQQVKTKQDHR